MLSGSLTPWLCPPPCAVQSLQAELEKGAKRMEDMKKEAGGSLEDLRMQLDKMDAEVGAGLGHGLGEGGGRWP